MPLPAPARLTVVLLIAFVGLNAAGAATTASPRIEANGAALAQAMRGHRVVLLGEVHDNAAQHALRLAAVRRLLEQGARPALAFEQFDRERQSDIDRARRARPHDAAYLIAEAKGPPGWDWRYYRPFVELALRYDLPIVAANLSRKDAMKVAIEGWGALFDVATRTTLALDELPVELRQKHEAAIAAGHCNLLPADALPAQARAQMARDIALARSLVPFVERGVVLLAGNGHVRRDIGVPVWLDATAKREAISIGLLERGDDVTIPADAATFDAYVITPRARREDPCKALAAQFKRAAPR